MSTDAHLYTHICKLLWKKNSNSNHITATATKTNKTVTYSHLKLNRGSTPFIRIAKSMKVLIKEEHLKITYKHSQSISRFFNNDFSSARV